jgi:hypothetical protein
VSPEHLQEILQLCDASKADERGFREFPQRTTLTLYLAKDSVGLTVSGIEAIAIRGHQVHARTNKGDLYAFSLEDVFAANIEGRAKAKGERRAGFAAG